MLHNVEEHNLNLHNANIQIAAKSRDYFVMAEFVRHVCLEVALYARECGISSNFIPEHAKIPNVPYHGAGMLFVEFSFFFIHPNNSLSYIHIEI